MAMTKRIIKENVKVWIIADWEEGYIYSKVCDIVEAKFSGECDSLVAAQVKNAYKKYPLGTLAFQSKSEALLAVETARLSKIQAMEREIARLKSLTFEE